MRLLHSFRFIHVLSTFLMILWGAIALYFYATGRIVYYLDEKGLFRPLVLWTGLGMIALGIFNLLTMKAKTAPCEHGHEHEHEHNHGCCGHDHDHQHGHAHDHKHGDSCCEGHKHSHELSHSHGHKHDHDCCSHEHHSHHCCSHGDHAQDHDEEQEHAHGVLYESGALGKVFAILMLSLPVTYAAIKTPDRFSVHAVMNKGVYHQNYESTTRAEEFSLKKKSDGAVNLANAETDSTQQAPQDNPPLVPAVTSVTNDPQGGVMVPAPSPDKIPEPKAQEAKDYGDFTLKDLEEQIPKSAEGYFMLEVPEIYYTASDKQVQDVLKGQPVETTAQILPEKGEFNKDGKRARIFRMQVQCCAADARPYSIPVQFKEEVPQFKDMSWVKIAGKMDYESQNGQIVPVLVADSVSEASPPDDTVVY